MIHRAGAAILLLAWAGRAESQAQQKPVTFTGDAGLVSTAGNTHLVTLSLGDKLTSQRGKLLLTQTFALVYGKTESVQTANSQLLRGRGGNLRAGRPSPSAWPG